MKILLIDTSTQSLSLAVAENLKIIAEKDISLKKFLSTAIIPSIDKILKKAKINLEEIGGFAVGLGPGSFTSLRVGLSTVKAIAFATGKPVVGVSSLDLVAMNVKDDVANICVVQDARRGLIYSCLFNKSGNKLLRQGKYMLVSLEDLLKKIKKPVIFIGDGIKIYKEKLEAVDKGKCIIDETLWRPKAKNMPPLVLERLKNGKSDNINKLLPLYLYASDCQVQK